MAQETFPLPSVVNFPPLLNEVQLNPFKVSPEKVPTPVEVIFPELIAVANKLVELAFVAKKLVVVALVEVELIAVKFCKVVLPVAKIFPAVRRAEMKELVPFSVVANRLVLVD